CRRYGIDNSHRTKHGALLDAELLADVYIELVGGKQPALGLEPVVEQVVNAGVANSVSTVIGARPAPLPPRISDEERAAHEALVAELGEGAIWKKVAARLV